MSLLDKKLRRGIMRMIAADGKKLEYQRAGDSVVIYGIIETVDNEEKAYMGVAIGRTVKSVETLADSLMYGGKHFKPAKGNKLFLDNQKWEVIHGPNKQAWDYGDTDKITVDFYIQRIDEPEKKEG